jgi:hypothetical protein
LSSSCASSSLQLFHRPLQDELDQDLVGVEGAGTLAGGLVGDDLDLAVLLDHFVFQEALVDRAELLDRKIPVVDPSPAVMRQSEDHARQSGVGQIGPFQQRRRFGIEQPTIVGRQAERRLTLVDRAEQGAQATIVVADRGGEGVVVLHALCDLVPDRAQAVVVVASIARR